MYNVLLVRPPFCEVNEYLKPLKKQSCSYPPFGLLNVASHLRAKGFKVDLWDMAYDKGWHPPFHEGSLSYSLIAISTFTSQLKATNTIANCLRRNNTRNNDDYWKGFGGTSAGYTTVVAGGSGVTSNPEYAKAMMPDVDVFYSGDGEGFADLICEAFIERGKEPVGEQTVVKGGVYRWEDYKLPAWDLVNAKFYAKRYGLAIETSRGCPHGCSMCTAQMIHGRRYIAREPKEVVNEMLTLNKRYGAKKFYFTDDNATVNPDRWIQLMQLIVNANKGFYLHIPEGIQAHNLTHSTLKLMKQAGFRNIFIGVESGNQRVLTDVVGKGNLKLEQVEQVVKDCKQIGLGVNCFFVVGLVGETLTEAEDTVRFAQHLRELGAYSCLVRNAIPIPGTRMFDEAKTKGYLTVPETQLLDMDFIHSGKHLLITPEWKPQQIEALVAKAKAQDANHILHSSGLVQRGLIRLASDPIAAFHRFHELTVQRSYQK